VLCEHDEAQPEPPAGLRDLAELYDAPRSHHVHHHHHDGGHEHSHGLTDREILRSHEGVKAVAISLLILGTAAAAQLVIFTLSGSVALLADLVHNFGDALTAIPLGIAFYLRSVRG
jgi:Co/Zn/Cd efflux system component